MENEENKGRKKEISKDRNNIKYSVFIIKIRKVSLSWENKLYMSYRVVSFAKLWISIEIICTNASTTTVVVIFAI